MTLMWVQLRRMKMILTSSGLPWPKYKPNDDFTKVILLEDYIADIPLRGRTVCIRIQKGFIWDGASVPRIARTSTYGPFHIKVVIGSLLHDFPYRFHGYDVMLDNGAIVRINVNRKESDKILKWALGECHVGSYIRFKMYHGVRIGGRGAWKN